MNKKHVWLMIWFIVLIVMLVSATVSAEISVGVKEGDWMEYDMTCTGILPDDCPTSIRIEVQSVQAKNITFEVTVEYSDGTQDSRTSTVDLEAGKLGGGVVVPANLTSGDTFYDENEGNVTISSVEERTCAGARRTVVYATVSQGAFYWDRSTGVLVEAILLSAELTMNVKADKTNMWQPQLFGLEPIVFYVLIIAVIATVAIVAFVIIRKRKTSPLSQ